MILTMKKILFAVFIATTLFVLASCKTYHTCPAYGSVTPATTQASI